MNKINVIWFFLVVLLGASHSSRDRNNKSHKVVCYWGSWSYYRPGDGKFVAEDADPNLCTHMIYGFAKLNPDNTIGIFDPGLDPSTNGALGMYKRWNQLRAKNSHLTTLIAIGGWNEGSDKYSQMASNPGSRKTFIDSVVRFLQTYDFDGLDIDWEYPSKKAVGDGNREPGNPADKQNYVSLLKELRNAFQPNGYILTVAVSAGKPTIDTAYDVRQVSQNVDIINLMAYDYHGGWDHNTAHNAPLHPHPNDNEGDKEFTVEYSVDYWIRQGADPKKIALGMPLYGRTFTLANPANSGMGAPVTGAGGTAGPFTRQVGILGYNEICQNLKSGAWQIHRDEVQKVPYAVSGNQWIGYDDEQSIKDKVDFAKSRGLGGGMVWSIDTDDFKGLCGKGKYPLLATIAREFDRGGPLPTDNPITDNPHTDAPITDATVTDGPITDTPTQNPHGNFECHGPGFFPDPSDKTIYHECVDMGGHFQDFVFHCGQGTIYDENLHICKMPPM